jgi:glycosyltransferase involved in cell wall biosynthesis
MPIGNPERDYENIVANIAEFEKTHHSELILVIDAFAGPKANRLKRDYSVSESIIVHQGHFGSPGAARNFGKNLATGDWISFIDSDDKIDFANFFQMVSDGNSCGADLSIGNYEVVYDYGIIKKSSEVIDHGNVFRIIARNPGIWRMSFKCSVAKQIDFPNLRMAEDQIFLARFRFWDRKVSISNLEVYTYRKNVPGQLTRNQEAISDLLQAQVFVIDQFFNESSKEKGSRILARIVVNQILTSIRYLGIQAVFPLGRAIRKQRGLIRVTHLTCRLGCTLFAEILYKTHFFIRDFLTRKKENQ